MLIELTDNEVKAIQSCIQMAAGEGYCALSLSISSVEFNTLLRKLNFTEDELRYLALPE